MGETFTHYARRIAAMLDRNRLTVEQAQAEIRPLLQNPQPAQTSRSESEPS